MSFRLIRPYRAVIAVFAVLALVATACGDDDAVSTTAAPATTAALATTAAPTTTAAPAAEPIRIVYPVSSLRGEDLGCPDCSLGSALNMNPMFESLLARDQETGQIIEGVGRLAETWSVNDDFTEFRFKLREGMQFHGGWGEVTTDDIGFSWDLVTGSATTNPSAAIYGKLTFVKEDKYNFRLISDGPVPEVLPNLTDMALVFMVTSKAYWETEDEEFVRTHPIGSGPFQFKEHVPGVSLTFEAFPEHYRQPPAIDEFTILVVPEFQSRFDSLQSGDAHVTIGAYDQIETAEASGLKVTSLGSQRNIVIWLPFFQAPQGAAASDPAPWDSIAFPESGTLVRKALSLLIDRQEIVDFLLRGRGTVEGACVQSWWPDLPGYNDDCVVDPYDPDQALALLQEAGFDSFSDLSVIVNLAIHPAYPACGDVSEAVAQQWSNAGVNVSTPFGDYGVVVAEDSGPNRSANWAYCFAQPAAFTGPQSFAFYSRTTDRLSYTGEMPGIDELVDVAVESEAFGGDVQEQASRALFDFADENKLGLLIAYGDFLYFMNSCLEWPTLPGTVAFNIHNIDLMTTSCPL